MTTNESSENSASVLQFAGKIAQVYDSVLGPIVFTPYAIDLVGARLPKSCSKILEIACGTGRVTSLLRSTFPEPCHITATDFSEGMLSVARQKVSGKITWEVADMLNLPYDDAQYDLVVAQFGVNLVEESLKAFSEAKRVLKPGGKFVFSAWTNKDECPMFYLTGHALKPYISIAEGEGEIEAFEDRFTMLCNVAYRLGDAAQVHSMLSSSGFTNSKHTTVTIPITDTALLAHGMIKGSPFSSLVHDDKSLDAAVNDLHETFGNSIQSQAHIFEATV